MIYALTGEIILHCKDYVVLEVNNVAYQVQLIRSEKVELNTKTTIYMQTIIKETEHLLFGFTKPEDKELFLLLTSVTGVGPKIASNIMNYGANEDIYSAIKTENAGYFKGVPGLGKALAVQIIFSLKSQIKVSTAAINSLIPAISALRNLGFKDGEINSSYNRIKANIRVDIDESSLIRLLLVNIKKGVKNG